MSGTPTLGKVSVARELLDSGEPVLIAKDGHCIGVSKIPFSVASQILSEISSCLDYSGLRLQAVQESLSFNSPIKASASSHLATSLQSSSGGAINQPNLLQGTCHTMARIAEVISRLGRKRKKYCV